MAVGLRLGLVLGAVAAAASSAALWGFTVDDALITARVAHHVATGVGYRMNPGGPLVDAVTPLGFAHLLAPFARTAPHGAFLAARIIGTLAWLMAAAWLGRAIAEAGERRARFLPLLLVAVSVPLGAWTTAGMETGLVAAFVTFALAPRRSAPLWAGMAAAWRPELLPFAMALGIGTALARERAPGPALFGWVLATAPALLVALVRVVAFGTPMPLAALAKPAGLEDGLRYAASAFLLTGFPLLVLAPVTARRLGGHELALGIAALLHFPALALAGGDWMPSFRLCVPVLPAFLWVGAAIAEKAALWATALRVGAGLVASALLFADVGLASRQIVRQRSELEDAGRRALAGARRIASLDAGWVGLATDASVIDVAGVTDPSIAVLPGGHTSKRLGDGFLSQRDADAVVALWDARRDGWYRRNDARLAELASEAGFTRVAELPLRGSSFHYVVFRRAPRAHRASRVRSGSAAPRSARRPCGAAARAHRAGAS